MIGLNALLFSVFCAKAVYGARAQKTIARQNIQKKFFTRGTPTLNVLILVDENDDKGQYDGNDRRAPFGKPNKRCVIIARAF